MTGFSNFITRVYPVLGGVLPVSGGVFCSGAVVSSYDSVLSGELGEFSEFRLAMLLKSFLRNEGPLKYLGLRPCFLVS